MHPLTTDQIRQRYLDFFKARGHAILPSASLIPENDPTVLFTTAGMHPLVPYLLGEPHPLGKRLASSQKCLRTDDIDEIGDDTHGTFFEMLGNWSLGDYFKEEAIGWSYELLTKKDEGFGLDPHKLHVTIFEGDSDAPRDELAIGIWQSQFEVHGIGADVGVPGQDEPAFGDNGPRIFAYPKKKNWWPAAGVNGPCGPDTEMFYDTGKAHDQKFGPVCHPNCDCGRFVEIWNDVFMQYERKPDGKYIALEQQNVDTGMGLMRMAMILQDVSSVYETDAYKPLLEVILQVFGVAYGQDKHKDRSLRIIVDHLKAATFLIGDPRGVVPSNIGQGYIVRRLIRRAVREAKRLGINSAMTATVGQAVIEINKAAYPELQRNAVKIIEELTKEEAKFAATLERGLKEFERMKDAQGSVTGEQAFILYSTYGFPIELTEELVKESGGKVDHAVFETEFAKHQDLSRTASAGTFKGGMADHSEEVTRLHTATHLLHQALRTVLGDHVGQKGSNITAERLRFDFIHPEKMTSDQIKAVEDIVNGIIRKDLEVSFQEMTVADAKSTGAIGLFEDKYGDLVKVYTVSDPSDPRGFYSKEICGGPHVIRTGEMGVFKIQKEEAVSAGVRRIKATVTGPT